MTGRVVRVAPSRGYLLIETEDAEYWGPIDEVLAGMAAEVGALVEFVPAPSRGRRPFAGRIVRIG